MRSLFSSIGLSPGTHWVQHNLPWLAMLALVFGFERDEEDPAEKPVQLDG
ncbi:hypothetical protein ACFOOL_01715 [Devosia honganensis]|uniref:Uncharacterized protein n=1 Tax=Devosia honganensis TaxID=1610527 RepID=A0ABV7WVZ2_9HYPH